MLHAASRLGVLLAQAGMSVVYGGGGIGLMGNLADAVIENQWKNNRCYSCIYER